MDIALVGATGYVGSKLLEEALYRGHTVTAIVRNPDKLPEHDMVSPAKADVMDVGALTALFEGKDAVIHAYAPPKDLNVPTRVELQHTATSAIITAAKQAGVKRILAVGGAGTLAVAPGVMNMDRPEFPKEWESGAKSTARIHDLLSREPDMEWTVLCPSHNLVPGTRTGKFRLGENDLLVGPDGDSRISLEDYAVAMLDELEDPRHIRKRFTVGY